MLAHASQCGRLFKGTAEDEELLKKIYDTVHLTTHIWVPTVYPHNPRVEFVLFFVLQPPRPSGPRTPALPALAHRSFVLEHPPAL